MTTAPNERAFAYFRRGEVRDEILTEFRIGLRSLINPETGVAFTEDEIARATQVGSRFWIEADAIDLIGQAQQSRALFLADQVRMDRASTNWLVGHHGDLWGEKPLPASPGSGRVDAKASAGTIFLGSTTIGDQTAHVARDPAGLRYQTYTTVTTPGGGAAELTFVGIDAGDETNLDVGTVLTWENPPLGAEPTCTVVLNKFTGGVAAEDNSAFQARLRGRVRHKPAGGNSAHFRAWAREASVAIEDGFVYSCALHAGSTLVAITQKRTGGGPTARVANAVTLGTARAYLTPPGSPVVPSRAFVIVTTVTPVSTDFVALLSQPKGNTAGWADITPWPGYTTTPSAVQAAPAPTTTTFRINSDTALPTGVTAPKLMYWDTTTSRFVALNVTSVVSAGGGLYDVTLATALAAPLASGVRISPLMARHETAAKAIESYFDELGPGEVVDLATDIRADMAARFPEPSEEKPYRAGQVLASRITDALGASAADASIVGLSATTPGLPTEVIDGPKMLTLGKVGVYELA